MIKLNSFANQDALKLCEENLKLCFVKDGIAWFTTLPLDKQQGPGWDKAPYEEIAGEPFLTPEDSGHFLFNMPYWHRNHMFTPDVSSKNASWSVEQINGGDWPWLMSSGTGVMAGTNLFEFSSWLAANHSISDTGVKMFWLMFSNEAELTAKYAKQIWEA